MLFDPVKCCFMMLYCIEPKHVFRIKAVAYTEKKGEKKKSSAFMCV